MLNKKIFYLLLLLIPLSIHAMEKQIKIYKKESFPTLHDLSLVALNSSITLKNLCLVAVAQSIVEKCNHSEEFLNRYAHDPGPWSYEKENSFLPPLPIELENYLWPLVACLLHSNNNLSHAFEKVLDKDTVTLEIDKKIVRNVLFPFYRNKIMNTTTIPRRLSYLRLNNTTANKLDLKRYNPTSYGKEIYEDHRQKMQNQAFKTVSNFNANSSDQNRKTLCFHLNMGWNKYLFWDIQIQALLKNKKDLVFLRRYFYSFQLISILNTNDFTPSEINEIINYDLRPHLTFGDANLFRRCTALFFLLNKACLDEAMAAMGELALGKSDSKLNKSPQYLLPMLWFTSSSTAFDKACSMQSASEVARRIMSIVRKTKNAGYTQHPRMQKIRELATPPKEEKDINCFSSFLSYGNPTISLSCPTLFPTKPFNFLSEFIITAFEAEISRIHPFFYHNKEILTKLDWNVLQELRKRIAPKSNALTKENCDETLRMIDEENQRRTKQSIATSQSFKKYTPRISFFES